MLLGMLGYKYAAGIGMIERGGMCLRQFCLTLAHWRDELLAEARQRIIRSNK